MLPIHDERQLMRYVEPFVGGGAVFFGLKGTTPFLRWVGGKRKLKEEVLARLLRHREGCALAHITYPWAWCGCHLPDSFLIADVNPDLVAAYTAVRDDVGGVVSMLKHWPVDKPTYAHIVQHPTLETWLRGARMIYLNKNGFNGLWRTNLQGKYNVPFGRTARPTQVATVDLIALESSLREASKALQGVSIACQDFSTTLSQCGEGDVVYCDPPYLPDTTSAFVAYTKRGEETPLQLHQRLALDVFAAVQRGARVVISNSPAAAEIYRSLFVADNGVQCTIDTVSTQRSIGVGKGEEVKRQQDEILVTVSRL